MLFGGGPVTLPALYMTARRNAPRSNVRAWWMRRRSDLSIPSMSMSPDCTGRQEPSGYSMRVMTVCLPGRPLASVTAAAAQPPRIAMAPMARFRPGATARALCWESIKACQLFAGHSGLTATAAIAAFTSPMTIASSNGCNDSMTFCRIAASLGSITLRMTSAARSDLLRSAISSGVVPWMSSAKTSAPASSRRLATASSSFSAALCSGLPLPGMGTSTFAPRSISSLTRSAFIPGLENGT